MSLFVSEHLPLLSTAPKGIQKLRGLILALAVRGKLVPQDPRDEPATELLKQIAYDRAHLDDHGAGKKAKVRRPIEPDERPYEIPSAWAWARFEDVFSLEYGDNLPAPKRTESGEFSVYGSNGVVGTHNKSAVSSPCIVVGRKGSAGALNLCRENGCWVTDVAYYCIPPSDMDLEFVFKLFHTLQLDDLGKGIKPGLSRSEAYALPIAVPPVAEQRRIVAKINELMALCDRLEGEQTDALSAQAKLVETLLGTLTQSNDSEDFAANWQRLANHFDTLFTTESSLNALKQSIMQLAVAGRLVPQDSSDEPSSELLKRIVLERAELETKGICKKAKPMQRLGEDEQPHNIPESWLWCRLAITVMDSGAGWSPSCESRRRRDNEWGVLKVSAVSWGVFNPDENKALPSGLEPRPDHEVVPGDFLVSRANTAELVARSVVVENCPARLMLSDKIVRLKLSSFVNARFINLANSCDQARNYYAAVAGGTSASMKNVSREQILNLAIPLPPLAEQRRIVARVDELMTICDSLKAELADLRHQQEQLASTLIESALKA